MQDGVYTGVVELELNDIELANFFESKYLNVSLFNNQYIIIKHNGKILDDKYRYFDGKFIKIIKKKFKNVNVLPPLDDIQLFAYDALFNNNLKVVCLTGLSGTGKTKTALSVGLELLKIGTYEKIILVRHAEESGKSIGFLKGTKDGKMVDGWAGCFYDNLPGERYEFEQLLVQGKVQIESISLLKGRNFKKSYIIFDESEDAFPEQIELVGTRPNDDSKLIFVGDYNQTSNQKYKSNSGLLKLIDKAKGKEWFTTIELKSNGRGIIANFFATEFKE